MFCHIHISLTDLSSRIGRAVSHPYPWYLSQQIALAATISLSDALHSHKLHLLIKWLLRQSALALQAHRPLQPS